MHDRLHPDLVLAKNRNSGATKLRLAFDGKCKTIVVMLRVISGEGATRADQ